MKGRVEHSIKTENNIKNILDTLPECVGDYYYNISVSKEPKSCLTYIKAIREFLKSVNPEDQKSIDISKIRETQVTRFMHQLETKKDSEGNIESTSFSYRKTVHTALNSFFTYVYKSGMINRNPIELIDRPKNQDKVQRIKLNESDLQKILKAVETGTLDNTHAANSQKKWKSRDRAIIMTLIGTGMRETALTEINVEDIDWNTGVLTIIDKRHTTHEYILPEELKKEIQNWLEDRDEILNGRKSDALFISNQRDRISVRAISNIVGKYSKYGIGKELSPHKLRAAFCTILYDKTGDIELVRDAVGHRNIATTQRYIVKDNSAKRRSSAIMNSLFTS